jgi:hypothetical protein
MKGRIVIAAAMVAPFLWVIGLNQPASAQTNSGNTKPYSVTISNSAGASNPATVGAGEASTMTITIYNENPLQTLGSMNLTLPADFVVPTAVATPFQPTGYNVSPLPTWDVNSSGVVEVRGLSLPYEGATKQIYASFQVPILDPCVQESVTALTEAKQANNFSGLPGNDLTLDPNSQLTVSVPNTSFCGLQFVRTNEPADTQINTPVSNTPFTPPVNPPTANTPQDVEAQVVDDNGVAINPADEAANTTSVSVALTSAPATILDQVTTSGGIASFPSILIGTAATYNIQSGQYSPDVLVATGTASGAGGMTGLSSGLSSNFVIWQSGSVCKSKTCQLSNQPAGSPVISAISGTPSNFNTPPILETLQQGGAGQISCGDNFQHAPDSSLFQSTQNFSGFLQVTITINNPVAPPSQYEVCFQDFQYQFDLYGNGGTPQLGPLGQPGILATCKQTGGAIPCVGSISKKSGAILEVIDIPPGDPCVH